MRRRETASWARWPRCRRVSTPSAPASAAPVSTATEPVFGLMSNALGLVMRNERFQVAVMNDAEPRPSDVVAFEDDLRGHKVAVLFYNSQASDTAARRLLGLARQAGIPVVGVTETEPAGMDYQHWMLSELDLTGRALAQAQSRPARP